MPIFQPKRRGSARIARNKPLVDALKAWLGEQLAKLSKGSALAEAIRYGLNHWQGLSRFLDDRSTATWSNAAFGRSRSIARTRSSPAATKAAQLGDHRLADRDLQTQRREPARVAYRHPDKARQPMARRSHRRSDALGLRQDPRLTRQRGNGAALTFDRWRSHLHSLLHSRFS
jgi:Transposase IS66 family